MKKIFKLLSISLILCFGLVGCDEDETTFKALDFPTDAFITFNQIATSVAENTVTPIQIEVTYANTSAATEDVSIDFTVNSDNGVVGTDFTIVNNKSSFTFSPSAGNYTDIVEIMPVDNGVLGTENIVVTLSLGSSTLATGYPGPDGLGKSIAVTIMDDDCAKEEALGIYAGNWLGTDSCGDYTAVPVELALPCGTGITIKGLGHPWLEDSSYWGETVIFEYDVKITIDAATGTVDIPEQTYVTTDYNGDISDYTIVGSGTIDSSGTVMTISYDMNHPSYGSMANDYAGSSCTGLFEAVITLQ